MPRCPSCDSEYPEGHRFCGACGSAVDETSAPTRTSLKSGASPVSGPEGERARFLPGAVVAGRYRIVGLLGRGGMGEVYRAEDTKLGRPVALKFLPPDLERVPERLGRFLNEARIALQVTHPNVCRVHDLGEIDPSPGSGQFRHYISMEYVDGEDLASLLRRIGRLPRDKATEIARQVCAGLAAAHEQRILHRDLKPANVMIDGRGRAKITDFGLAGLAEAIQGDEVRAGTPGYLSPEQAAGQEVTIRSDVYALGLVLYELYTGKRAYEAATPHEMARLQQASAPVAPSSHVGGLDPAIERLILRCLERDPRKRPASALAVAAALPGGDALAAALAAGETPSPELVAAAGTTRGLRPGIAWSLLLATLALLFLAAWLAPKAIPLYRVPLPKPPAYLAERARAVIRNLGYEEPAADSEYGFFVADWTYARYLTDEDRERSWERLADPEPPLVSFWYRQHRRPLVPWRSGWVTPADPPCDESGMIQVGLDTRGRLWWLEVVSPRIDEPTEQAPTPDWRILFEEAGLDIDEFATTAPTYQWNVFSDTRSAWRGTYPQAPDVEIRVNAQAYRGRPVSFVALNPWDTPDHVRTGRSGLWERIQPYVWTGLFAAALLGGLLLARRNLRLGRADPRGALRLAGFMFAVYMLTWMVGAHHVADRAEVNLFIREAGEGLGVSAIIWIYYVALEPHLRRLWPHTIVSWVRLLDGRFRDPLVGRDLLVGSLYGWILAVLFHLHALIPRWVGLPPPDLEAFLGGIGGGSFLASLRGMPRAIEAALYAVSPGIRNTLMLLVVLLVLRVVFRRTLLAAGLLVPLLAIWAGSGGIDSVYGGVYFLAVATVFVVALLRLGVLVTVTGTTLSLGVHVWLPMTLDFSTWYAGATALAFAIAFGLAIYGFHTSLAGRPALGDRALDG
jgi:serine/threonine-protein kinase